jgi:hypothetical protein
MKKIKKEDLDAWLRELRNPENIQGKYVLKNMGCYCALGLLCKVTNYTPKSWFNCYPIQETGLDTHAVPKAFKGLMPQQQIEISFMNDGVKNSFEEIAQWVETNIIPEKKT